MIEGRSHLNSPLILQILAGLYPALFYASNNWFIYTKKQLITLLVFSPIFVLTIAIICYAILSITLKVLLEVFPSIRFVLSTKKIQEHFFTIFPCAIMYFLLQTTISALIRNKIILISTLVFITVLFLFGVYKLGLKYFNIFMVFLVSTTVIQWLYSYHISKTAIQETLYYAKNKSLYDTIQFNRKPNLYLIVLESYQNNDTLKRIYNFDNHETEAELAKKGFDIYDNVYSNYWVTIPSVLTLFTMEHHYFKISKGRHDAVGARNIIGGITYNPVLSVLKNNGYKIQYVLENDRLFFASDLLDYVCPRRTSFKVFEIFQIEMLDKLLISFFKTYRGQNNDLDRIYLTPESYRRKLKKRIALAAKSQVPYFTFMKINEPGHFSEEWDRIDLSSIKNYPREILEANAIVIELVDSIIKKDSKAIIILIGDHGAWRYRNIWKGGWDNIHRTMKERGVEEDEVAQDLFGTFFAIRNPEKNHLPVGVISHVNLFRYIFSVLSNNDAFLKTKAANESYVPRGTRWIAVREAKPLKFWEDWREQH